MDKNVRQIMIGSSYSLLALIAVKLVDIISSIIVARLLGPKNLGMFAVIRYLLDLLCIFTVCGISTAMVKFIAESKSKPEVMRVAYTSFLTMLIPLVIVCAAIFIISDNIAQNIYHQPAIGGLIRISIITLFGMSIFTFGSSILQGLQEIKKLSLTQIINSIIGLPLIVILVYYGGLKGAVISRAVIAFIGVGILGWIISRIWSLQEWRVGGSIEYDFIKRLVSLALPTFLSGVVMVPALWIITTRLSITHGFAQVGLFNVAYALMQMILFIPVAIGMPLVPKIAELNRVAQNELNSIIFRSLYLVGIVTLTISMVFSIFSKNIVSLLYGADYLASWSNVILLSTSAFLASFGYIVGYYLLGTGKMWIGFIFNLIWFICLIGTSFPLVSRYGVVGLGISYVWSYIVMILVMFSFIKKRLGLAIIPLVKLMISGLLFACLAYCIVNHLQGGVLFLGNSVLFISFLIVEYFLCPMKSQIVSVFKLNL